MEICVIQWMLKVLLSITLFGFTETKDSQQKDMGSNPHTLLITTVLFEPYVMLKNPDRNATGNSDYTGYIVDMLNKVTTMMNIQYKLVVTPDGKFGHRQDNKQWDGMIGQLLRQEVHIAASPMYITPYRSRVVDFSLPFMDVSATILLRRPPPGHLLRVNTAADIINQSEIKYGTLQTGIIPKLFRSTNDTVLKIMWRNIGRFEPTTLTDTNEEGIERVRKQKYAYILANTIGEYISNKWLSAI